MIGRFVRLALLVGLLVLLGFAIFRPAAIFGVDAKALANSLGGEVHHSDATCTGQGNGIYRCALHGESVDGVEYALTTHRFGCWSAARVALPPTADEVPLAISGCIGLTDEFGN